MDFQIYLDILKVIATYFSFPICIALIIYIWKTQKEEISEMKVRIKKNEEDIQDFRCNYLDRFKEINEKNTCQHQDIKEKNAEEHTEIKIMIAKIFTKLGIE